MAYSELRYFILELENAKSASQSVTVSLFCNNRAWLQIQVIWDFRSSSRHDFPKVHNIIGEKRQHNWKPWITDCAGWLANALCFSEEILLALEGSMQKFVEKRN